MSASENGFGVEVREGTAGWSVAILDPAGAVVGERVCGGHVEARTYASTVRQHMYWLSPEKFREYYRVGPRDGPENGQENGPEDRPED